MAQRGSLEAALTHMQSTQVHQLVGHLNLTRRVGQAVVLTVAGLEVTVRIGKLEHGRVVLEIDAPLEVDIAREESVR